MCVSRYADTHREYICNLDIYHEYICVYTRYILRIHLYTSLRYISQTHMRVYQIHIEKASAYLDTQIHIENASVYQIYITNTSACTRYILTTHLRIQIHIVITSACILDTTYQEYICVSRYTDTHGEYICVLFTYREYICVYNRCTSRIHLYTSLRYVS